MQVLHAACMHAAKFIEKDSKFRHVAVNQLTNFHAICKILFDNSLQNIDKLIKKLLSQIFSYTSSPKKSGIICL